MTLKYTRIDIKTCKTRLVRKKEQRVSNFETSRVESYAMGVNLKTLEESEKN